MAGIKIGLEIHVSLNTVKSKLFCFCPIPPNDATPNTYTCPVCLGHPGAKPVLNEQVLKNGILLALALDSTIQKRIVFSRKSYFYPDMPNNYQITQFEIPLAQGGHLVVNNKKINLTRLHIEEDPAALVHSSGMQASTYSLVDYNRAGTPLIEIVTEPEITSPEEAREFMKKLLQVLSYLGIFDNGTIKADANVSIEASGYTRVEVKNIGSFKEIEKALKYEIARQWQAVEKNEKITIETRAWDSSKGITFPLRSKESEEDYGYIVEPNLPIFNITDSLIKEQKENLPELPKGKVKRFQKEYGLKEDDAKVLSANKKLADFFEDTIEEVDPAFAATWIRREVVRQMHEKGISIDKIDKKQFIELLKLFYDKKITDLVFRETFQLMLDKPIDVFKHLRENDLMAITDNKALEETCDKVIDMYPDSVEDYKQGKEKALNYLMGKVMQMTQGKASPNLIVEILRKKIKH